MGRRIRILRHLVNMMLVTSILHPCQGEADQQSLALFLMRNNAPLALLSTLLALLFLAFDRTDALHHPTVKSNVDNTTGRTHRSRRSLGYF